MRNQKSISIPDMLFNKYVKKAKHDNISVSALICQVMSNADLENSKKVVNEEIARNKLIPKVKKLVLFIF